MSSVFEFLDAEVDLEFLLPFGSLPQFSWDKTIRQPTAQRFSPYAFAWDVIELAALQLAKPAMAADNWFDSNEIDEVVPVISEDGVTQSNQSARLCAAMATNRPATRSEEIE